MFFFLLFIAAGNLYAQPISDFDIDIESWGSVCPDACSGPTIYSNASGVGGTKCITGEDESVGTWYFLGNNTEWKGNLSAYEDCWLLFYLKQNSLNFPSDNSAADIVLIRGDNATLNYETGYDPGAAWTFYYVQLSGGAGCGWTWTDLAGAEATVADMASVLLDLKRLRIRAEFSGLDYEDDYLDEVEISCTFIPLPVQIVSFGAEELGNHVARLTWITSAETNNKGFTIQKSSDGIVFDSIGYVEGHGTITTSSVYTFYDDNFTNSAYYRLKQIDYNGDVEESKVVFLPSATHNTTSTLIYPNPATNQITIAADYPVLSISIISLSGSVVYQEPLNFESTEYQKVVDVSMFPNGIYTIAITGPKGTEQHLFEVMK